MSIIENAVRRLNEEHGASGALASRTAAVQPSMDAASQLFADAGPGAEALAPARPPAASPPAPVRSRRRIDIDLAALRKAGMAVADTQRSIICEEFRTIKRPLLAHMRSTVPNIEEDKAPRGAIMVSSSVPGEGKTYCSVNLALSIATERDYHVLLVDADVARPSVPRALGIEQQPGLLDVLRGELTLDDTIVDTNVPSLSLLMAGKRDRHATELLASRAMESVVAELSLRYPGAVVIFDSPPLLAASESQVLSTHMGQIVMVVEAQSTSRRQLREALAMLGERDSINLIFNKARRFSSAAMYGQY